MSGTGEWWDRARHADRRPVLLARNRIQAALRDWFGAEGFTEVDPAALQVSPGNEAHLHAFATAAVDDGGAARRMFLHTSPEFAMKKLLAAGETRIFAFSHVWRNRERGALHAPEFTMLEWYRAGEDYGRLMEDCREVFARAAEAAGAETLRFRERTCDPYAGFDRVSVAEAAMRHAGVDLMATLGDAEALAEAMEAAGVTPGEGEGWSDLFSRLLVARSSPGSATGGPACSTAIRPPRRRSRGAARTIRGCPSASSSTPAGWNWRTASAS
jgi:elongation factor P--(R)-beta-lysine ligase